MDTEPTNVTKKVTKIQEVHPTQPSEVAFAFFGVFLHHLQSVRIHLGPFHQLGPSVTAVRTPEAAHPEVLLPSLVLSPRGADVVGMYGVYVPGLLWSLSRWMWVIYCVMRFCPEDGESEEACLNYES